MILMQMAYTWSRSRFGKQMVELFQKTNLLQCFQLPGLFNNSTLNVIMQLSTE